MNRRAIQIERAYHNVEKIYAGGDRHYIINTDTGEKISEVSNRYTLIKNKDIFQPFIEKFGIENVSRFIQYGNGKYTHMEIETGRGFDFGERNGRVDTIKERLVIQNSYNKTKSFAFMFGAFRLICTNGLYTGTALINYKKIHVGEIPVAKLIADVLNRYQYNSFELWQNLKNIPLDLPTELELIEKFRPYDLKEEQEAKRWNINNQIKYTARRLVSGAETLDNQRNAWGLFNMLNRAIDRNVRGDSQIQKRITANKRAEEHLTSNLILV